jgi:hypothetical protein
VNRRKKAHHIHRFRFRYWCTCLGLVEGLAALEEDLLYVAVRVRLREGNPANRLRVRELGRVRVLPELEV